MLKFFRNFGCYMKLNDRVLVFFGFRFGLLLLMFGWLVE